MYPGIRGTEFKLVFSSGDHNITSTSYSMYDAFVKATHMAIGTGNPFIDKCLSDRITQDYSNDDYLMALAMILKSRNEANEEVSTRESRLAKARKIKITL